MPSRSLCAARLTALLLYFLGLTCIVLASARFEPTEALVDVAQRLLPHDLVLVVGIYLVGVQISMLAVSVSVPHFSSRVRCSAVTVIGFIGVVWLLWGTMGGWFSSVPYKNSMLLVGFDPREWAFAIVVGGLSVLSSVSTFLITARNT